MFNFIFGCFLIIAFTSMIICYVLFSVTEFRSEENIKLFYSANIIAVIIPILCLVYYIVRWLVK